MLIELLPSMVWQVLIVLARVGAALMLLTGYGETYVPARWRIILAFLISLILVPIVEDKLPELPASAIKAFLLVASEAIVGVFIGVFAQNLLVALLLAGTLIAYQIGLANAFIFNAATSQQSALPGAFLVATLMTILFVTDMHHLLLLAVAESYGLFTPGSLFPIGDFTDILVQIGSAALRVGLQLSGPFLVVGLVFYLGIGVLSRLMPQIQIFFIALPIQLLIGLSVLFAVLSSIVDHWLRFFETNMERYLLPG